VFIFHQLDRSGAPLVGIDIVKDVIRAGTREVHFISAIPIDTSLKVVLNGLNVDVVALDNTATIFPFLHGRDVFVNSSAVPEIWLSQVLEYLDSDHKAKGYFFVHENDPETFLDQTVAKKLLDQQSINLSIFTPSSGASNNLNSLHRLGIKSKVQPLLVTKAQRSTTSTKTDSIEIVLVGPTNDFRKRQLDVLIAVHKAQMQMLGSINAHRPIKINFIGIGNDPTGNEVKRLADQLLLPSTYEIYGKLDKCTTLEVIAESNVVVSLSSNESFGLYIAEAMTAGAIVLRTNVSGHKEMLKDSINGFTLDGTIEDLAEKLLYISDTTKFSNEEFDNFMKNSMSIIEPYTDVNYITMFESKTDF
jgi:glycosyltransferase involved in cell wall biosynthesis